MTKRDLFKPQPDSVEEAKKLLIKPGVAQLLSKYLLGDNSLVDQFGTNEKLRANLRNISTITPSAIPPGTSNVRILQRVKEWQVDFENQVKNGSVAQFHYIWLPNDHTDGTDLNSSVALSVCGPKRCGPGPYHRHDIEI